MSWVIIGVVSLLLGFGLGILFNTKLLQPKLGDSARHFGVFVLAVAVSAGCLAIALTKAKQAENSVSPQVRTIAAGTEDPQLAALLDYTIFHIGVYITLTTGLLAALSYKLRGPGNLILLVPIIVFALAGAAGGMVGSHIPNYPNFKEFANAKIVFGNWTWFPTNYVGWAALEHRLFWLGAVALILILAGRAILRKPDDLEQKVQEFVEAIRKQLKTTNDVDEAYAKLSRTATELAEYAERIRSQEQ